MSSLGVTSTTCLLSFALLLQTVFGVADPLFHSCSNENFTASGPYATNLKKLMGYLYHQAPPTGFGLGSLGQDPNNAHGLALCRGDVSTSDCKSCITEASRQIHQNCPYSKGAQIWYDKCLLKYSDKKFFGQIDNGNKLFMWNFKNVSNPVTFNHKSKELLSQLSKEASVKPKMYAAGELQLGYNNTMKVYGLAQCTRDLSHSNCRICLDGIIADLPNCCDGKEGGRVVTGSCIIRYEIYRFLSD